MKCHTKAIKRMEKERLRKLMRIKKGIVSFQIEINITSNLYIGTSICPLEIKAPVKIF